MPAVLATIEEEDAIGDRVTLRLPPPDAGTNPRIYARPDAQGPDRSLDALLSAPEGWSDFADDLHRYVVSWPYSESMQISLQAAGITVGIYNGAFYGDDAIPLELMSVHVLDATWPHSFDPVVEALHSVWVDAVHRPGEIDALSLEPDRAVALACYILSFNTRPGAAVHGAPADTPAEPFRSVVPGIKDVARGPEPQQRLLRTARDGEETAAAWVAWMGYADARATAPGADGGVDVRGTGVVAQVKMEAVPVGRPVVQALYGIAVHESAKALFFSQAGYTAQALNWANAAGVALFSFNLQGEVVPVNAPARRLSQVDEQ